MRDWTLARIVWVADRGFSSAANRRYLRSGDRALHHRREAPLRHPPRPSRPCPGRAATPTVADNMQVKEVNIGDTDDRFVICYNPEAADRDPHDPRPTRRPARPS